MGHSWPLFHLFLSFCTVQLQKNLAASGIRTRIVGAVGKNADHYTTTTAHKFIPWQPNWRGTFFFKIFLQPPSCVRVALRAKLVILYWPDTWHSCFLIDSSNLSRLALATNLLWLVLSTFRLWAVWIIFKLWLLFLNHLNKSWQPRISICIEGLMSAQYHLWWLANL